MTSQSPDGGEIIASCSGCDRTSSSDSMWALYCLDCAEKIGRAAMAERSSTRQAPVKQTGGAPAEPTCKPSLQVAELDHPEHGLDMVAPTVKDRGQDAEPVAWMSWADGEGVGYWTTQAEAELNCSGDTEPVPLYRHPPRREWQGLTKEARREILDTTHPDSRWTLVELVEDALKRKNHEPK